MLGLNIIFAVQVVVKKRALLANCFLINSPKCFVKRNTNLYQTQANVLPTPENYLLQLKNISGMVK